MITNSDAESSLTLAATNHEIRKIVKKTTTRNPTNFDHPSWQVGWASYTPFFVSPWINGDEIC